MAVDTTTAPELTAEQVLRILVQPLETESVFLASGPRVFDTAGPVRVPKLGGPITDPGRSWRGSGGAVTSASSTDSS